MGTKMKITSQELYTLIGLPFEERVSDKEYPVNLWDGEKVVRTSTKKCVYWTGNVLLLDGEDDLLEDYHEIGHYLCAKYVREYIRVYSRHISELSDYEKYLQSPHKPFFNEIPDPIDPSNARRYLPTREELEESFRVAQQLDRLSIAEYGCEPFYREWDPKVRDYEEESENERQQELLTTYSSHKQESMNEERCIIIESILAETFRDEKTLEEIKNEIGRYRNHFFDAEVEFLCETQLFCVEDGRLKVLHRM